MTAFNKRVVPVILYGAMALGFVVLLSASRHDPRLLPLVFLPVLTTVIFHFVRKFLLADLVDEVWDAGQDLIVKNDGQTERIAFANIMNVSYTVLVNPPRVTLQLRLPTRFGHRISFMPVVRFLPFASHPAIDELIQRIDKARRAVAG